MKDPVAGVVGILTDIKKETACLRRNIHRQTVDEQGKIFPYLMKKIFL